MLVNEEEEEEGMLLLILLLLVLLLLMVVAVLVVDNMGWGEWQRKTGAWKWRFWLDHLLLSFTLHPTEIQPDLEGVTDAATGPSRTSLACPCVGSVCVGTWYVGGERWEMACGLSLLLARRRALIFGLKAEEEESKARVWTLIRRWEKAWCLLLLVKNGNVVGGCGVGAYVVGGCGGGCALLRGQNQDQPSQASPRRAKSAPNLTRTFALFCVLRWPLGAA